jgi:hypothetical protein
VWAPCLGTYGTMGGALGAESCGRGARRVKRGARSRQYLGRRGDTAAMNSSLEDVRPP